MSAVEYIKNFIHSDSFQKFANSNYENDCRYHGNFFSEGALKGRAISFIDIGAQVGRGVYDIINNIYKQSFEIKNAYIQKDFTKGMEATCFMIGYSEIIVLRVIAMVALDILGIAVPDISRYARNISKNIDPLCNDLVGWIEKHKIMPEYFATLGLNNIKATTQEIERAYKKLALKYHPDRTNGDLEKQELFKKVAEAYEFLKLPANHSTFGIFVDRLKHYGNGIPN
jgi:hypothetical protein